MKIKTFLLIALAFAGVWVLYSFFNSEGNAQILTATFRLWGLSFKVLEAFLVAMAIAAVFPATYFSYKYLQLAKSVKKHHQAQESGADEAQRFRALSSLLDHGKYEQLLNELRDWPESGRTRLLEGKAWLYSHQPERAVAPLRRAFEEDHIVEAGYLLAKAERNNGKSPIPVLTALIANNPSQAERAYKLLLDAQSREGYWQEGIETLARMEKLGLPVDARLAIGFRFEMIQASTLEPLRKKVDRYLQLIKEDPEFIPAYIVAGECYAELKAPIKMLSLWEQGYSHTGNLVFLDKLEEYYLLQNRPEDAIQIYREILVREDIPVVRYRLAQLYSKLEMLDESLELLQSLRTQFAEVPGFLTDLADGYARRENYREAYQTLLHAVSASSVHQGAFECKGCGRPSTHWEARCTQCRGWNLSHSKLSTFSSERRPSSPLYY